MGAFKENWQRDQSLNAKLLGYLRWLFNIALVQVMVSEAVTDSDSIRHAAITCLHNLLIVYSDGGREPEICLCNTLVTRMTIRDYIVDSRGTDLLNKGR